MITAEDAYRLSVLDKNSITLKEVLHHIKKEAKNGMLSTTWTNFDIRKLAHLRHQLDILGFSTKVRSWQISPNESDYELLINWEKA